MITLSFWIGFIFLMENNQGSVNALQGVELVNR